MKVKDYFSKKMVVDYLGIEFDDEGYITLELEDINDLINLALYHNQGSVTDVPNFVSSETQRRAGNCGSGGPSQGHIREDTPIPEPRPSAPHYCGWKKGNCNYQGATQSTGGKGE
jgi:hypothetical protein